MIAAQNRATGPGRRRGTTPRSRVSVPRVLLGAVLVLGLGLAGVVVAGRLDIRVPVLATSRPLAAGQVFTDADLVVVRIAAGPEVAVVPATRRSIVVGHTAATPLVAGVVLTPGQVGASVWPPAGWAVVGVATKPGRVPYGLGPGARVLVLVVPTNAGTGSGPGLVVQAEGTVVDVAAATGESGVAVVSVLVKSADATRVASTSGESSVVQLGGGR
jgi:hypothetical protein